MSININNYINISIGNTPTSISERNVSIIAIFTKEQANVPINKYLLYKAPAQASQDWGINSNTYKMVNAIFSQSPNILTAGGYVMVFPLLSNVNVPASAGYFETKGIIYQNFAGITDGSIGIQLDGAEEATQLTGLDFSNVNNNEDLVQVLQAKINGAIVSIDEDNNLVITSSTTGATSSVVLSAGASGTDLSTVNLLNIANAEVVSGEAEYSGQERLQDVIVRSQGIAYYGAALPAYLPEDEELMPAAEVMQSYLSLLVVVNDNIACLNPESTNVFYNIQQASLNKCRCLYYGGQSDPLNFAAAYTSSYLAVNYGGVNTVKNLHAKELIGILPDNTIGEGELQNALACGVDVYPAVGGVGAMYCSGKNGWFDVVAGLNWLQIQLENAGFSTLRNVPTKVPQTEQGVSLLYSAYERVLRQAVLNGFLAGGEWTLPFTFGNAEDLENSIQNDGFYIYFTPLALQPIADREARKAPYAQIGIKLAGAINSSDVLIFVNL